VRLQPEDLDDILARIRKKCKEERIRINEFLRDFDKLRSGFITEAQFRIGLNMAKIVLSGAEFDVLSEAFRAHQKEGKHIRWRDFCDSIEEVFTKKGLEKAVDMVLDEARTQTFYGRTKPSKYEQVRAQDIVDRFRALLLKNRLDAKSFFQDWDRHKSFKISPKQFRQVLANFGFLMTDEELDCIVRNYGDDQNDVKYVEFLRDSNPNRG